MRRSTSLARGQPHVPVDDPDVPGCCRTCGRPTALRNDMHLDEYPTTDPATAAEERRRLGEKADDE